MCEVVHCSESGELLPLFGGVELRHLEDHTLRLQTDLQESTKTERNAQAWEGAANETK